MNELTSIPTTFTLAAAVRNFELVRSGTLHLFRIEIGQPIQDVETVSGPDWRCPVRFIEDETIKLHNICGIDSFQALHLAFNFVQRELESIVKDNDVELRFSGSS